MIEKICPQCQSNQPDGLDECLRCGIVFAKYKRRPPEGKRQTRSIHVDPPPWYAFIRTLLLPPPYNVNPLFLAGRGILFFLLLIWSYPLIFSSVASNYAGQFFMHLVNLPFHEAGHIFLSPFGHFIQALGGSLGQLAMPLICMVVLLFQTRDAFGAAVATWWLAESFMDLAPYINDARALDLVLLGGVTGKQVEDYHDWEFILRKLGLLHMDHALAATAQAIGIGLMVSALAWALMNIWIQFKDLRQNS